MENKNIEKIYFVPGNLVIVKHDLDNRPVMLVTEVVTSKVLTGVPALGGYSYGNALELAKPQMAFKGIRCGWFDADMVWREQIFSTKDIIKVEEGE